MANVYVVVLEMPDESPRHCIEKVFSSRELADTWVNLDEVQCDYEYSIVEMKIDG